MHDLSSSQGNGRSHKRPLFHAFNFCETVSSFVGKIGLRGKTWMAFGDMNLIFRMTIDQPVSLDMDLIMSLIDQTIHGFDVRSNKLIRWGKQIKNSTICAKGNTN